MNNWRQIFGWKIEPTRAKQRKFQPGEIAFIFHYTAPKSWDGQKVEIQDGYRRGNMRTYYLIKGIGGEHDGVTRWVTSLWLNSQPRELLSWQIGPTYTYKQMINMLKPGQIWKAHNPDGRRPYIFIFDPAEYARDGWHITIMLGAYRSRPDIIPTDKAEMIPIFADEGPFELVEEDFRNRKLSWQVYPKEEYYRIYYSPENGIYNVVEDSGMILFESYLGEMVATWIVENYKWNYQHALDLVYMAKKQGVVAFSILGRHTSSLKLSWLMPIESKDELHLGDRVQLLRDYDHGWIGSGEIHTFIPAGSKGTVVHMGMEKGDGRVKVRFDNPAYATPAIVKENLGMPRGGAFVEGWYLFVEKLAKVPND